MKLFLFVALLFGFFPGKEGATPGRCPPSVAMTNTGGGWLKTCVHGRNPPQPITTSWYTKFEEDEEFEQVYDQRCAKIPKNLLTGDNPRNFTFRVCVSDVDGTTCCPDNTVGYDPNLVPSFSPDDD